MITEAVSAVLQVLLFTLVPLIVYLIRYKKLKGFFVWIGLTKPTLRSCLLALLVSFIFMIGGIGLVLYSSSIREVMTSPPSITGKLHQQGFSITSMITLVIIACVKTSFSEEILFRGFLAKRLISWLGYRTGNLLQAIIFGLIHVLLFAAVTKAGIPFLVYIFLFSGLAAFVIGYLKEKVGNGSIIPGWIAHGVGNLIAYTIIGFLL